ncbi:MAG: diacylglycerol kinase family protein [Candidatus Dormiibacterota bacterium]
MSESAVLVNPIPFGDQEGLRRAIIQTLSREGWPEPKWFQTTRAESGKTQTQEAILGGARVVFVCGGDGTVSAAAGALAGTDVALAVIPSGTGNLLALNLGLPTGVADAVRVATQGGRRRIDLGEVDGRLFTVAAGIGLDAQILADTPHGAKHRLGWPAYAASALKHLRHPRFLAHVSLDGGPTIAREVHSVLVANVGRLPGGITLLPGAVPDDGLLDVAFIAPRRLRDWVGLLTSLIGQNPKGGQLERFRVHRVEISTDLPQLLEVDGETLTARVTLSVVVRPRVLTLCVPRTHRL